MIRRLPWWGRVSGGILVASVLLAWAIDRMMWDFADSRVGEGLSLLGVLILAVPALWLNALARQRRDLNALVEARRRRREAGLADRQREDAEADIKRLEEKLKTARASAQDWTRGAEICLLAGYGAILTASLGRLFLG